jgi:ribonucleoside-diphosphate reductase alpha chain
VLVSNDKKDNLPKTKAPKRPDSLPCDIYCFKVDSKEFFVAVGLLEGEPYEVFASKRGKLDKTIKHGNITKLKRGHYNIITENEEDFVIDTYNFLNDTEQAITRLVSCALRHGADVAFIVDQLEKTDGNISSFSKSVARALKKYIKDGTKAAGSTCQTCKGSNLVRNSGCVTCMDCGWSKCG